MKSKLIVLIVIYSIFSVSLLADNAKPLLVMAAASTTNVITEAINDFQKETGVRVTASFAASSALARQIVQGAPADIYVSANIKWMNYLEDKQLIMVKSKTVLFSNSLVLIAPSGSLSKISVNPGLPLADLLGNGYLAVANPDHTPVGIYAKQSLISLELWEGVKNRIARTKDVRAALMLVERAESPLGIVYQTDAMISEKINIVGTFPKDSHSPIVYLCALLKGGRNADSQALLLYLKSNKGNAIFKKYGFITREL